MNKPLTEFVLKPLMFSDTQIHMGGIWGWGLWGGGQASGTDICNTAHGHTEMRRVCSLQRVHRCLLTALRLNSQLWIHTPPSASWLLAISTPLTPKAGQHRSCLEPNIWSAVKATGLAGHPKMARTCVFRSHCCRELSAFWWCKANSAVFVPYSTNYTKQLLTGQPPLGASLMQPGALHFNQLLQVTAYD